MTAKEIPDGVINDELDLVRQAQSGDDAAFCALVEIHARRVHRLAMQFCRNSHDAEDLSQEVWLKAHRAINQFRGESSFFTWLRQILVRTFLSHQRGKMNNAMTALEDMDFAENHSANGWHKTNLTSFDDKVLVGRVHELLVDLTPQQRMIFLLKHEEGMTYEEIAAELKCSSGSVKKSLFRTVHKLRQKLGVNSSLGCF
jgi:RNA polymerase sigma-70 factor (ECF subfamily)